MARQVPRLRSAPIAAGALASVVACGTLVASAASPPHPEGFGTEYLVTTWTTANGLPQNSVTDLLFAGEGGLWIATYGGLVRFDGARFRTFDLTNLPGLPSNRITGIAVDGADGLWLTTQEGHLAHVSGGSVSEVHPIGSPAGFVNSPLRDERGRIWCRDNQRGIARISGGRVEWVSEHPPFVGFRGLEVLGDGSVVAAVGRAVVRFPPDDGAPQTIPTPAEVLLVAPGERGVGWLGLGDRLARFDGGALVEVTVDPPLPGPVRAILDDEEAGLIVGAAERLLRLVPAGAAAYRQAETLLELPKGFALRRIQRDAEGNLWIGTEGRGLSRVTPQRVAHIGPEAGLASITALADGGNAGLWIGAGCQGLRRLTAGRLEDVVLPLPPRQRQCVNALLTDSRGRLWIASGRRVLRLEAGRFVEVQVPGAELRPTVGPIVETGDGSVWVSSTHGQLVRFGSGDVITGRFQLQGNVVSMAPGESDSLWVGSTGAVFRVARGGIEAWRGEAGIPPSPVRDLMPASGGGVWLATYGSGIGLLRDGRSRWVGPAQGLPDASLSRILDDGGGRFWLLSNTGLVVLERDRLLTCLDDPSAALEPVVLGPERGVPEGNYGAPAGVRDASGRLWFGTIDGIVGTDPAGFPFNRRPPPVRIEAIRADGDLLPPGEPVRVPAGTRRLVIEYAALAFTAADRTSFRVRMDGFDGDWVAVGSRRTGHYTRLRPGRYSFRVVARNEDGVWSTSGAAVALQVLPAWWQTPWVRVVAGSLSVGLLVALHLVRLGVVRRRDEAALQRLDERRRAEQEVSRLRDQLEHVARVATASELATSLAHEVNQPLTAIVANAQAGRSDLHSGAVDRAELDEILGEIVQQGQRAADLVRRLREFIRRRPTVRVPVEINALVRDSLALVRRELEDSKVRLELDLAAEPLRVTGDRVQLQQVLVNLVVNACEALSGVEPPRRLSVRSRRDGAAIQLEVWDTGPGIPAGDLERVFEPFFSTRAEGLGLGLAISRSIVEDHGGRLHAEPAPGGGARFRCELPAAGEEPGGEGDR